MKKVMSMIMAICLMLNVLPSMASAATTNSPVILASFTTNPVLVSPGGDGYIELTVRNSGSVTVSNVKIDSIKCESPITPSGKWLLDLGSLSSGDSVTSLFKFNAPSTTSPGIYAVNFEVKYCYESTCNTINPNAMVKVQSDSSIEIVSIEPNSLEIGETTEIVFKIMNIGQKDINNLVFSWDSSSDLILPLGTDNKVIIREIKSNSYVDVPVNVIVSPSITPGIYSIDMNLQYYDKTGTMKNVSSAAGIIVGGLTDFDVSVQETSSSSTTFYITNIGSNAGYSVIVSVPEQSGYRTTGSSSSVIGNLDAGDYTLVTFQVMRAGMGNEPFNIEISYTDTLGIRRTITKEVAMSMHVNVTSVGTISSQTQFNSRRQQTSSSNSSLTYAVVLIVGAAGILAYYRFRKKRDIAAVIMSHLKPKKK